MSPFPNLTVAENMYIGREPHKLHFLKKKELREKAKAQLKKLNISLNIDTVSYTHLTLPTNSPV